MSKEAWKKILKAMYKHPYITMGSIGLPVLAFKATTGAADKVHSTYDIVSQHKQKAILEKQLMALKVIMENTKKQESSSGKKRRVSYYSPEKLQKKEKRYF